LLIYQVAITDEFSADIILAKNYENIDELYYTVRNGRNRTFNKRYKDKPIIINSLYLTYLISIDVWFKFLTVIANAYCSALYQKH